MTIENTRLKSLNVLERLSPKEAIRYFFDFIVNAYTSANKARKDNPDIKKRQKKLYTYELILGEVDGDGTAEVCRVSYSGQRFIELSYGNGIYDESDSLVKFSESILYQLNSDGTLGTRPAGTNSRSATDDEIKFHLSNIYDVAEAMQNRAEMEESTIDSANTGCNFSAWPDLF